MEIHAQVKAPCFKSLYYTPLSSITEMAPYYEEVCKELKWKVNNALLKRLKDANEKALKKFDEKISETEEMEYESEVRDALLAKAEYLCQIGNRVS